MSNLTASLVFLGIVYSLYWLKAGHSPWKGLRAFSVRAEAVEKAILSVLCDLPHVLKERLVESLEETRKETA